MLQMRKKLLKIVNKYFYSVSRINAVRTRTCVCVFYMQRIFFIHTVNYEILIGIKCGGLKFNINLTSLCTVH